MRAAGGKQSHGRYEKTGELDRSFKKKKEKVQDFPSSLVVGKLHFHFRVWGFNPWLGKRRSHMLWGVAKK